MDLVIHVVKTNLQPLESTSKGLNRASWNKVKDNIDFLWDQSISLQPFWRLPIKILNPWEYFQILSSTPWKYIQKSKYIFSSHQLSYMKFSTQAHHGWTISFMLSKTNLKPLESTLKAYFQPHATTSKGLNRISRNKVRARIKLQWDQLTSLQPFWWLPNIFFNPWEYFQSLSSPLWKYFQRSKYSFSSDQPSSMKFSTQAYDR